MPGPESEQVQSASNKRHLWKVVWLLAVVLTITAFWWWPRHKFQQERSRWKTTALEQLAGLSITNQMIREEFEQLKSPTPGLNFGWTHQHVLLMTNGEYIIFEFWHGANNGAWDHLFLGHGSDGRWLYSTYHFCTSMAMLQSDKPPGSIGEFCGAVFCQGV